MHEAAITVVKFNGLGLVFSTQQGWISIPALCLSLTKFSSTKNLQTIAS